MLRAASSRLAGNAPLLRSLCRPGPAMAAVLTKRSLLLDASLAGQSEQDAKETANVLRNALGKELAYEKENYQRSEDISRFMKTAKFQVEDNEGIREVYLNSKHGNEEINITFGLLDPEMDIEAGDEESVAPVPFTACITKEENGMDFGTMTLQCEAYEGQVEVLALSVAPTDTATGQTADEAASRDAIYPGPKLADLDEELQRSLGSYWVSRGIDGNLATFIESMYYDKEQREYMKWLADLQAFVKA